MIAIERLALEGTDLLCPDGYTRRCFPVLAASLADYEEQVLITGVLANQHCTICQVRPEERNNLLKAHPFRTHDYTRSVHCDMDKDKINKRKDPMRVHQVRNFVWAHLYVNVHQIQLPDMLHQLYKGLVMRTIKWLEALIKRNYKQQYERRINKRIASCPQFPGLKHFFRLAGVKQWTAGEQKAILRQILPALAPLLRDNHQQLRFTKAAIDFCLLADYSSHSDVTLGYVHDALKILNQEKSAFVEYTPTETESDEFNFPKWHVMSHYIDFIKAYGALDGYNTEQTEACHKYIVKCFYDRTNKIKWEEQLIAHVVRQLKFTAMNDVVETYTDDLSWEQQADPLALIVDNTMHVGRSVGAPSNTSIEQAEDAYRAISLPRADNFTDPQYIDVNHPLHPLHPFPPDVYYPTRPPLPIVVGERLTFNKRLVNGLHDKLPLTTRGKTTRWPTVYDVANAMGYDDFPKALLQHITTNDIDIGIDYPTVDDVYDLTINVSVTLTNTRRSADAWDNPDQVVADPVRCSPKWRKDKPRMDFVWVQEWNWADDNAYNTALPLARRRLKGRRAAQLQLLFTLRNHVHKQWKCVFLRFLNPVDQAAPGRNHELIEFMDAKRADGSPLRTVCDIDTIVRSAHMIPSREGRTDYYFANPYTDWDAYNTLHRTVDE